MTLANSIAWIIPSIPRLPKPPGTRAADSFKFVSDAVPLDFFRIDVAKIYPAVVGYSRVAQGFVQAFIGVDQIDVFSHDRYRHIPWRGF